MSFPQNNSYSLRGLKDVTSLRRLIIRTTAIRVTFTENKTVKHVEDSYRGPTTVLKEIPQLPQVTIKNEKKWRGGTKSESILFKEIA